MSLSEAILGRTLTTLLPIILKQLFSQLCSILLHQQQPVTTFDSPPLPWIYRLHHATNRNKAYDHHKCRTF